MKYRHLHEGEDQRPKEEIYLYPSGQLKMKEWTLRGLAHRVDGPAFEGWHPDGGKQMENWQVHGIFHREGGPAVSYWGPDGRLRKEMWFQQNQLHRLDGPAVWDESYGEEWWIDGKQFTESEWLKRLRLTRVKELFAEGLSKEEIMAVIHLGLI